MISRIKRLLGIRTNVEKSTYYALMALAYWRRAVRNGEAPEGFRVQVAGETDFIEIGKCEAAFPERNAQEIDTF